MALIFCSHVNDVLCTKCKAAPGYNKEDDSVYCKGCGDWGYKADIMKNADSHTKFEEMMQTIKESERDGLAELPPVVAIQMQSGFLLGFANCWNRVMNAWSGKQK